MRIVLSLLKVLFVLFLFLLVITQATDADLLDREVIAPHTYQATTLDFSNRDTANNAVRSLLFQKTGFLPGGFAVEALRIQKEGELTFAYRMEYVFVSGDPAFCEKLHLRVLQDWKTVHEARLVELNFSSSVQEDGLDDLVFVISLPADAQTKGNCVFDFRFTTQNNENGKTTGFSDEERIQNIITAQE